MIETTNNIWNKALYDKVKPESLLTWQRVIVANRMSTGGKQWAEVFSKFNSGTYVTTPFFILALSFSFPLHRCLLELARAEYSIPTCNSYNCQWMVVDYKLFELGQPLKENLLWIVEQIPGTMVGFPPVLLQGI